MTRSQGQATAIRRIATAGCVASLMALAGCSQQWARVGLPEAASEEAPAIGNLWVGAWIASLVIGVAVWGLILWATFRYRRKDGDQPVPRQTKYHLPLELLYTLVPFLIVGVLFVYTVRAQDTVLAQDSEPDLVVDVIGQKWSWTFNYHGAEDPNIGVDANEVGTLEKIPDLYLPVNKTVRFNLASPDVIHSFWVPAFYFKQDVVPGHPNSFDVTPNKVGVYDGKCAELCGTYHALMLFEVHVVSEEEYAAYVKELAASSPDREGLVEMPSSTFDTIPSTQEDR